MTLQDWMNATAAQLDESGVFLGHGTDNSWDEALHLTLPLLDIPFDADPSVLQRVLTDDELSRLHVAREQRIARRIPTPYITRQAWFCGLPFYVDERVLIPRSPLGELIDDGFYPWLQHEPARILDLCCGSACIGIACAETPPISQPMHWRWQQSMSGSTSCRGVCNCSNRICFRVWATSDMT